MPSKVDNKLISRNTQATTYSQLFPPTGEMQIYSGSITSGGTAQIVIPVNKLRDYLYFQNTSDTDMYIDFGTTPKSSNPTSIFMPGNNLSPFIMSSNPTVKSLRVLCATTSKTFVAYQM